MNRLLLSIFCAISPFIAVAIIVKIISLSFGLEMAVILIGTGLWYHIIFKNISK